MTNFEQSNNTQSSRELPGTSYLNSIAEAQTNLIFKQLKKNEDKYTEKITESKTNMNTLDELIKELSDVKKVQLDELSDITEDILLKILRSQQSNKSRCKSKLMTLENYKRMMNAAIIELLIRRYLGLDKSRGRKAGTALTEITDEKLAELQNDQAALRKEIRNIQSRKSIMKSKADFSEENEVWVKLLEVEEKLKSIRTTSSAKTTAIKTMLDGIENIENLKASDMQELLRKIADEVK